ncbi:4-hydroxybenzoate polyprenyltransferase [Butyrivibrio sp. INlla21]|nr:UbiA family prenyltransferase [Butyrivibrio sp. INlla21]SFU98385.1 4-hydroxybenzoate polyprenyltransferase [Butyrivibrio sp. INlla21]
MLNYLKIARPDHWIKNIFIIPGVALAWLLANRDIEAFHLIKFIAGFFATCFIASANYVINEWLDAGYDQYHPVKKNRPVVVDNIQLKYVILEYILFAASGLVISLFMGRMFFWNEIWLLVMGILYNVKPIRTKDIVYVDVLTESINNIIRLMLGWSILTSEFLPPVSVVFGYWMAGAFLMTAKRYAEYKMIGNPELAASYRKSFKYYSETRLLAATLFYAMCSTFSLGIFLVKYKIEYIFAVPVMFVLFIYYFILSFRFDSVAQRPEKLYKEKSLMMLVGLLVVLLIILSVIRIDALNQLKIIELLRY